MRNFPLASMISASRGIDTDEKPPTTAILRSLIKTVISGRAGAPVASITVTCVTARREPAGLEQPNRQIAAKKYVKLLLYLMRRPGRNSLITGDDCIFSTPLAAHRAAAQSRDDC